MVKKESQQFINDTLENIKSYVENPHDIMELGKFMSQFYDYSARNQLLIKKQYPFAVGIGSFNFFKEQGLMVRKGEKAIKILAPSSKTFIQDENGELISSSKWSSEQRKAVQEGKINTINKTFYNLVNVFDITQTNAKPEDYPKIFPNRPFNFDFSQVENKNGLHQGLMDYINRQGYTFKMRDNLGGVKGVTIHNINNQVQIELNSSLNIDNQIPTLIHEITHAKLHNIDTDTPTYQKEFEAEFSSFITCHAFGIDTSEKAIPYISKWTENLDKMDDAQIQKSLNRVQTVSKELTQFIMDGNYLHSPELDSEAQPTSSRQPSKATIDLENYYNDGQIIEFKVQNSENLDGKYSFVLDSKTGLHQIYDESKLNDSVLVDDNKQMELMQLASGKIDFPITVEQFTEDRKAFKKHIYPHQSDYSFLAKFNDNEKLLFNQLNGKNDKVTVQKTGFLAEPFVTIDFDESGLFENKRILTLKEFDQIIDTAAEKDELIHPENGYDKIDYRLHTRPNLYFEGRYYANSDSLSLENSLSDKALADYKECTRTINHFKEHNSFENKIDASVDINFKGHKFNYLIEIDKDTKDIRGQYIRDNEEPRQAKLSACINALNFVLENNLNPEDSQLIKDAIQHSSDQQKMQEILELSEQRINLMANQLDTKKVDSSLDQLKPTIEEYSSEKNTTIDNSKLSWKERIQLAKQIDIIKFAEDNGFNLHKDSNNQYSSVDNHSLKFTPSRNMWYDYATQEGGDTISFAQKQLNMSFNEAVNILSSLNPEDYHTDPVEEKEDFVYKTKETPLNQKQINYLVGERNINKSVLNKLIDEGLIVSDQRQNIIFKWKDEDGNILGASEQGVIPLKNPIKGRKYWKSIQKNSHSEFGFNYTNGEAKNIKIFEAPIDMMSYMSVYGIQPDTQYVSMDGLKSTTMFNFIEKAYAKGTLNSVEVCVDNDEKGHYFFDKLPESTQFPTTLNVPNPMYGKDWNDVVTYSNRSETTFTSAEIKQNLLDMGFDKPTSDFLIENKIITKNNPYTLTLNSNDSIQRISLDNQKIGMIHPTDNIVELQFKFQNGDKIECFESPLDELTYISQADDLNNTTLLTVTPDKLHKFLSKVPKEYADNLTLHYSKESLDKHAKDLSSQFKIENEESKKQKVKQTELEL